MIYYPFETKYVTQHFGENANSYYRDNGLLGHTDTDWGVPYGTLVPFCVENSYVYSILNKDNPDPSRYRSVYTLVERAGELYEVSYGHLDQIFAEVGKTYQPSDFLGTVGNTGDVYSNGRYVTKEEKLHGSKAGTHLHGPQVRPIQKVDKTSEGKRYLSTGEGIYRKDGFYFEVKDYDNGFNGCISAPYNGILAKDYEKQIEKLEAEVVTLATEAKTLTERIIEIIKKKLSSYFPQ